MSYTHLDVRRPTWHSMVSSGHKKTTSRRRAWPWHLWRRPRFACGAVLCLGSLVPVAYLVPAIPLIEWLPLVLHFAILVWLIVTAEHRVHRLRRPREIRFWHEVSLAFVVALAALLVNPLFHTGAPRWFVDGLITALLISPAVVLIYAVEGTPHQQDRASLVARQDSLSRWSILCFLILFVAYFELVPSRTLAGHEILSSLLLHAGLYCVLLLRLWRHRRDTDSPRWRQLYGLMGLAVLPSCLLHLLLVSSHLGGWQLAGWEQRLLDPWLSPLLAISYLLWGVTMEARFLALPAPPPPRSPPKPVIYGASASFFILLWAFVLPCLHLLLYQLGWLAEEHVRSRQGIVSLSLIVLGGIALRQHWTIRQSSNELLLRRARAETALRKSEASVRLTMQRQSSAKELRVADERFAKFFRSSPNALLITALDNGDILETNDHFEELSGYQRRDLIGVKVNRLQLWRGEDTQATLSHALQSGKLRNRQLQLIRQDGDLRHLLLSAEPFDMAGRPCMLAVLRDISRRERSRRLLRERSRWRRHIEQQIQRRQWPAVDIDDSKADPT